MEELNKVKFVKVFETIIYETEPLPSMITSKPNFLITASWNPKLRKVNLDTGQVVLTSEVHSISFDETITTLIEYTDEFFVSIRFFGAGLLIIKHEDLETRKEILLLSKFKDFEYGDVGNGLKMDGSLILLWFANTHFVVLDLESENILKKFDHKQTNKHIGMSEKFPNHFYYACGDWSKKMYSLGLKNIGSNGR